MSQETAYGAILLGGSAVLLVMGVMHPSAIPWGDDAALARLAVIDAYAHSLAILGTGLTLLGLVGLSRMLGSDRVPVTAALVAFALASAAVIVAATLDGFALPSLARQWTAADQIAGDDLKRLVRFCVLTASSLTRVYLLLGAVAIALWSWVIHRDRLDAALPWVGALVCLAGIALLIGGSPFISAHEVLALVAVQTVWMLLAALLMIRATTPREAAPVPSPRRSSR
jgi:drug/metabolite transporter superfamily protein YnfA